jgi:hypothetical protein
MPRVSGDTQSQAGSAWLATAPPSWLLPTQRPWPSEVEPAPAAADEVPTGLVRAPVARSTSALRRLTKNRAA